MGISFKVIKAKLPKGLTRSEYMARFKKTMNEGMVETKNEFAKTTSTWKHKVNWSKVIHIAGTLLIGEYTTNDDIYTYVSGGTKPHKIIAKKNMLVFQSGYAATTSPRRIQSIAPYGPFGGVIRAKVVNHPGTEAREFDKALKPIIKTYLEERFRIDVMLIAKQSGHSL